MKTAASSEPARATASPARPFFRAENENAARDAPETAAHGPTFFRAVAGGTGNGGSPAIQAKCTDCEAEEREQQAEQEGPESIKVQRMPAFEGGDDGDRVQRKPMFEAAGSKPVGSDSGDSDVQFFPPVQAKLTVGRPGDSLEREADSVAEHVVRGESVANFQKGDGRKNTVSRSTVPASGKNSGGGGASVTSRITSPSGGRPLPAPIRDDMESSFGADFSAVRIHDSAQDQADAHELGAQAFTHKSGIWLGPGSRDDDRSLMAHELTHVLQQGGGVARRPVEESEPDDTGVEGLDSGSEVPAQSVFLTSQAPDVQAAWYNFSIPFTDYEFDPSIRGIKNAAGLAKDTIVDSANWVRDRAVEAFQWVFDKIKGLVSAGIDWLSSKFTAIKEFAKSSFQTVRNGLSKLMGFIVAPANLIMSAFASMNADLLGSAWELLKTGALKVWTGMKATINGVLAIGSGLWDTASGYVSKLFASVSSVINSWPFRQLPDFLRSKARALFNKLRALWRTIRDFITSLLKRLRAFVKRVLDSIESFAKNVVSYGIQKVVDTVRAIADAWEFVKKIAEDPKGFIRPTVNKLAAKLNAEAPPKAIQLGEEKLQEKFSPGSSGSSGGVLVQRQAAKGGSKRRTATFNEVKNGFTTAIGNAWGQLNIGEMLMTSLVNMFWPPATIRAIGHEFSELWNKDWANAVESLFAPRSILDDFAGFFHDVWSNILILVDFPLALWRRLNSVFMLLLGYLTIILVIVFAVAGGIAGAAAGGAGAIPGAIAGAAAGLEIASGIGLGLLVSYFAAEWLTVVKTFVELFTARQTQAQKDRDYVQIAGSLIGMGVAAVLVAILFLISSIVGAIVRGIKGGKVKPPAPKPGESGKVAEPVKAGESAKPAEPAKPVEAAEPAKPSKPSEPSKPAEPKQVPGERPPGKGGTGRELGLSEQAVKAIEKMENIKADPVGKINSVGNKNHYKAARREAAGEVVARRPDGRPYDHIRDLQESYSGLQRVRRTLKREMDNPPWETMTERGLDVLTKRFSEVQKILSRLRGFLDQIGHGKFPPYHEWPPGS